MEHFNGGGGVGNDMNAQYTLYTPEFIHYSGAAREWGSTTVPLRDLQYSPQRAGHHAPPRIHQPYLQLCQGM